LFFLGAVAAAYTHFAQGIALYDSQRYRASGFSHEVDEGVNCRGRAAWALWCLGYLDQGLAQNDEALTLSRQSAHPLTLGFALSCAAIVHQCRREWRVVQECAEAAIHLATERGFPHWNANGILLRGWALAQQGQAKEGIALMHQGLKEYRAIGAGSNLSYFLALLAEAYEVMGQPGAGLITLAEALTFADRTGERWYEPEIHRLKGELLPWRERCYCLPYS
jgi:predicted ATPase